MVKACFLNLDHVIVFWVSQNNYAHSHNKDDIKKSEISSKWEYRDMNNVTDGLTLLSTYKLTSLLLT